MRFLRRPRTPAELLARVALGAALVLILFAGYTGWQVGRTITAVSSDPLRDLGQVVAPTLFVDPAKAQPGMTGALARGERINILLLGYGCAGHDGAFLTDSIMLASIDGRSGAVALISVPRDLWVTIPKNKYSDSHQAKVNNAFSGPALEGDRDEGMRAAAATLQAVLGLRIDRTIALDFRAFRTVVDQVGGIDVIVDRSFSSIYPRNDNAQIDASWIEVSFKAGPQHMNGETSLRYARARYADGIEGSDFARSDRQQKVILATRERVIQTAAAPQLLGLLDALRDNVRTDLSLADMRALGEFARGYDDAQTVRGALTNGNVLQNYGLVVSDGIAATLQPRVQGWLEVQAYVRRLVEFPGSLLEDPMVVVTANARRALAGQAAARVLENVGYRVRFETAADTDPAASTITGVAAETIAALIPLFGATSTVAAGDVIVRIGTEWQVPQPFQQFGFRPAATAPAPEPTPSPSPSRSPSPTASPTPPPARSPSPSPAASPAPTVTPLPVITPNNALLPAVSPRPPG